ncbi:clasp N terminal-domain-containing protein, partial [Crucibulum laeve]
MESESAARVEKLINQSKSNDVDVKVDALVKLQAEFESGSDINDPDALVTVLKTCLRTSNQHLTNATLSVLPPLFPLLISRSVNQAPTTSLPSPSASTSTSSVSRSSLIDVMTLRQTLTSFLPAGGIIDRLGDKERAQLKAREALVILGGFAFRSGATSTMSNKSRDGKGPETPLMIFERFLKEGGLSSKVWKVREQAILTLVHIRRAHHLFPIRPYLNLLVGCLEDTDAHVRECAKQSIIELFSGPGVTDGARADLKKELTKKGVRKTIVDGVLSKVLGGVSGSNSLPQSHEGSENGDATDSKPRGYVPPSLALQGKRPRVISQSSGIPRTTSQGSVKEIPRPSSRAAAASPPPATPTSENSELQSVYIASARDLENEFAAMAKPFEGKETEHNWAAREQSILRVRGMIKGDVHLRYMDVFLAALKEGFIQWSLKTLASLRTTVATNTCSLYTELAIALGPALDPFCDVLFTNLLKMAGFTKRIAAQQSQASVTAIITYTSAPPRVILPLLWNTLQEKTVQARAFVVAHIKHFIETHARRSKHNIESSGGLDILEKSLKKTLADPNPAVRETARALFWVFEDVWRDRGEAIMETLDSVARKQLEKACPNPELAAALPPTTPKATKKTSVAAAIAASRAKAKAIATAPPSLRHQATSGSHAAPVRRSSSPSTSPRSSVTRPASPLRTSTSSSPPPRTRVTSVTRSVSTTAVPPSHSRTASGGSNRATSPSPSELSTSRRRTSSPLVTMPSPNRTPIIRKAMQTALPASPASSVSPASPTPRGNGTNGNRNGAVPVPPRQSSLFPQVTEGNEDSLLLAQTVPIPEGDSDSEDDRSVNLMSFSAPFEMFPPILPTPSSQPQSLSPRSNGSKPTAAVSNALSSGSMSDIGSSQPVVEDALRARAEQAESAAERLLELVEPEDEDLQHPILPASLLMGNGNGHATPKPKSKPSPLPISRAAAPPVTPLNNHAAAVMRRAAMFQDSPAYHSRSSSLMNVLQDQKHETGWWLKRKAVLAQIPPIEEQPLVQLEDLISALEKDSVDISTLKNLVLFCRASEVYESFSPPPSPGGAPGSPSPFIASHPNVSSNRELWEIDHSFDRLFKALVRCLEPIRSEEELEYALIVVWEMLEHQAPLLEGKESELFSALFQVRYCNKVNVLEATNIIRDAFTARLEPVYGLTTMHANLRVFQAEAPPSPEDEDVKSATFAFGLMALGKFILRLPAEIAEEELPRLKSTLINSLNNKSSLIVRESAAASIIAAQLVLRDETHLFALLDGLADDKKNLLTYLFDKHGARGLTASTGPSGMDKLEKEIRRLDTRTGTPSK